MTEELHKAVATEECGETVVATEECGETAVATEECGETEVTGEVEVSTIAGIETCIDKKIYSHILLFLYACMYNTVADILALMSQ